MSSRPLDIVILGLSITSSWGNGHATTYRGLVRALERRGHKVLFLERDVPWYAAARDLPDPPHGRAILYGSLDELKKQFSAVVRDADVVIVGSYVPDGVEIGEWVIGTAGGVTAFYDIDTPITLARVQRGEAFYLTADLIRRYDLYFSFTGGPILRRLEVEYGARMARALYCAVDPDVYRPLELAERWDLGYMGTYSPDRQPILERLLLEPARRWSAARMVVAGPQYPQVIDWPANVERIEHLPPREHPVFYNEQGFSLNLTRSDMTRAGYSPSIRLFEAAACACPVISDWWEGLDSFFEIGTEILVANSADRMLQLMRDIPREKRRSMGHKARKRVLSAHTVDHRAIEFENYVRQAAA